MNMYIYKRIGWNSLTPLSGGLSLSFISSLIYVWVQFINSIVMIHLQALDQGNIDSFENLSEFELILMQLDGSHISALILV